MKKFEKPEFKIARYNTTNFEGHFEIEPLERRENKTSNSTSRFESEENRVN